MIVFRDNDSITKKIAALKKEGKSIGFVPTMGALHQGHLSLIELGKQKADITVASIFINPTQFNDPKDYEKYPVTTDNDISLLENTNCDILFLPGLSEIYPEGTASNVQYQLGKLENVLEGKFRPGHFQGVAQVVHRLLNIVQPDFLFLGSKDYQQVLVIKKLVDLTSFPVEVITGDTLRETSGLAMSSRNLRLSREQLQHSTSIHKALLYIKDHFSTTPLVKLESDATTLLLNDGFSKVDYVAIVDAQTLETPLAGQKENLVALIAAFMGDVRLIDNIVLAK